MKSIKGIIALLSFLLFETLINHTEINLFFNFSEAYDVNHILCSLFRCHGYRWSPNWSGKHIKYVCSASYHPNNQRSLQWRHNGHDGVSNHHPHGRLLNRLFRRRSKKTSRVRVSGLCVGSSPGPVNSPHKGPVTRKFFPFEDVFMSYTCWNLNAYITGGQCGWECNVKTTSIVQVQINGVFFYWIDCFIWK